MSGKMPCLLQKKLRQELVKSANAKKASEMQAYMKSAMPYYGIQSPIMKVIERRLFAGIRWESAEAWASDVLTIWREATHREERYAAISLARHRSAREFQDPKALKIYEEMIVTGAWWDYVDVIAAHLVGPIVREYPKVMRPKMLAWSKSKNLWKRRTAILCQLSSKKEVDLPFLYACIKPALGSDAFFLQKAIGWALRQVAWFNPGEVKRYVKANEKALSPLSKREALKNL